MCLTQSVHIPDGLALSSISVPILLLTHFPHQKKQEEQKEQESSQGDIKAVSLVKKKGKNSKQSKGNHPPHPMGRPVPRQLLTNLETASATLLLLLLPQVLLLSMMLQGKEVNSCKTLILPQRMCEFLGTCNH